MAEFQAATRRAGTAFAQGRVTGRSFGTTKPRSRVLALRKIGLRRRDRKLHNGL
jgi:hypothetical protein